MRITSYLGNPSSTTRAKAGLKGKLFRNVPQIKLRTIIWNIFDNHLLNTNIALIILLVCVINVTIVYRSSSPSEMSKELAPVMQVHPLQSDSSLLSRLEEPKGQRREPTHKVFGIAKGHRRFDRK